MKKQIIEILSEICPGIDFETKHWYVLRIPV